ncbi:hypothetical protein SJI45_06925 [Streptomyces sp. S399]|nr:hypothetical protein [Streptomyces sp. S399]WPR50824.1 hypothetical protein SJI45_06925 [Streptomyces sp. S399]
MEQDEVGLTDPEPGLAGVDVRQVVQHAPRVVQGAETLEDDPLAARGVRSLMPREEARQDRLRAEDEQETSLSVGGGHAFHHLNYRLL